MDEAAAGGAIKAAHFHGAPEKDRLAGRRLEAQPPFGPVTFKR